MACHEIAALRLGLMHVLGINNEAEKQHELSELGEAAKKPGPVCSLLDAKDLSNLKRSYEAALSQLERRVSSTPAADPKLPYLRSLIVLTKKVELDLRNHIDSLTRFYRDLEEMHDFVHEVYPK